MKKPKLSPENCEISGHAMGVICPSRDELRRLREAVKIWNRQYGEKCFAKLESFNLKGDVSWRIGGYYWDGYGHLFEKIPAFMDGAVAAIKSMEGRGD